MGSYRCSIGHESLVDADQATFSIVGNSVSFVIQPANPDPGFGEVSFPLYGFQNDVTARATWRTTADRCTGWDWTSPPNAAPANLSGIFKFADSATNYPTGYTGKKIFKLEADWCDLEPTRTVSRDQPGTYNLSIFNQLQTVSSAYDGIQVDVRGCVFEFNGSQLTTTNNVSAPLWLGPTNNINWRYTGVTRDGAGGASGTPLRYYDIGDPSWYIPFRHLIDAIANYIVPNSGGVRVPAHPRLLNQIVHGQSSSVGEEAGLGQAPTSTGHVATLQRWASAYGANSYKLAWCGEGKPQGDNDLAVAAGLGSRGGIIEKFLRSEYTPHISDGTSPTGRTKIGQIAVPYTNSAGVTQTDNYYLDVDESFPPIRDNRHFADQNEFPKLESYGTTSTNSPPDVWDIGSTPAKAILGSTWANLRTVQMRRNITAVETPATYRNGTFTGNQFSTLGGTQATSINGFEGYNNPQNINWMGLNLGKRVDGVGGPTHRAREAWCALFRTWTRAPVAPGNNRNVRIHNFEFFLKQRETNGATVPAVNVDWGWNPQGGEFPLDDPNYGSEFWVVDRARTMASATTGIGLTLDKRFLTGASTSPGVAVKVIYLDNNTQTWTVESRTSASATTSFSTTNQNTGLVKTRTVFFPNFFVNASAAVDLWLKGSTSTPFMFVRVIKLGTL